MGREDDIGRNRNSRLEYDDVDEELFEEAPIDSNYDLVSQEEKELLDKFAEKVLSLAKESPVELNHISQFWGYLSNSLYKSRYEFVKQKIELENQKTDLEHFLIDIDKESDEYIKTLRKIGDTVIKRRTTKDIASYMGVVCTNLRSISNFVKNMQERSYSPRSYKYGDTKPDTKVKLNPISSDKIVKK